MKCRPFAESSFLAKQSSSRGQSVCLDWCCSRNCFRWVSNFLKKMTKIILYIARITTQVNISTKTQVFKILSLGNVISKSQTNSEFLPNLRNNPSSNILKSFSRMPCRTLLTLWTSKASIPVSQPTGYTNCCWQRVNTFNHRYICCTNHFTCCCVIKFILLIIHQSKEHHFVDCKLSLLYTICKHKWQNKSTTNISTSEQFIVSW